MLLVISFAFGDSSDVKLHYSGHDLARAKQVYEELNNCGRCGDGYKDLVELLDIKEGFDGSYTCFWGYANIKSLPEGIKRISSNNCDGEL